MCAEMPVMSEWNTWEIHVDADIIEDGINEVRVRWPYPESSSPQVLDGIEDSIDSGLNPELYPVFGEIHSFNAQAILPR